MGVATLVVVFVLSAVMAAGRAEPAEDKRALLEFARVVPAARELNWDPATSACDAWTGVTCSPDRSRVVTLRLPGVGLRGPVPAATLGRLSALRVLSLRSNALSGPFPPDLAALSALTHLHLQLNSFSGPLPSGISAWPLLTNLDLSSNAFNASIPASLSALSQLAALNLSNNSLSGPIPDLPLRNLRLLDLSHNRLSGSVPPSLLLRFPNSSFSFNNFTSFSPSPPPLVPPPLPAPPRVKKLGESALLGIVIGGCALAFVVLAMLLLLCYSRRKIDNGIAVGKGGKGERSPEKAVRADPDASNRLVFFDGCAFAFDLEDLLRASAEVLGKGALGTAYRAVLEDGTAVVVKRLKEVGVGRREFEQQMEAVGRVRHENVVELRAYYYSKDEKLMVYDYYGQGSVSALLHAKRGESRTPVDWETRLRIALGAARGIACIHTQGNGKLVHGNIKASNVFLNSQNYGSVSDLGLTSLMTQTVFPVSRTAGYRAPEVVDTRKVSQASDVYSFGVLVLELLTGKSPIQITGGGDEVVHLVRWVQSVVREEWTAEVFDVELMRYPGIEEEMVEMLQIAMACVVKMPDQRPKMLEVVRMIEGVRRIDTGNRPSSEAYDSNGMTPTPVPQSTEETV